MIVVNIIIYVYYSKVTLTLVESIPQQWDTNKLVLSQLCLDTFLEHYTCLVYIHWSSQSHTGDHCTLQILKDNNYINILQGCKCNIAVSISFICKGPFTIEAQALYYTLRSECFSFTRAHGTTVALDWANLKAFEKVSHIVIILATVYNLNQKIFITRIVTDILLFLLVRRLWKGLKSSLSP